MGHNSSQNFITPYGGRAIELTNCYASQIRTGDVVRFSSVGVKSFTLALAGTNNPVGVSFENVDPGEMCWVVTDGPQPVLLQSGTGCTATDILRMSATEPGRVVAGLSGAIVGQAMETVAAGGASVLCNIGTQAPGTKAIDYSLTVGAVSVCSTIGTVGDPGELRTLAPGADGTICQVLGFWAQGDGGGGTFIYDAGSVATDNGGTIIAAAGGVGRWIRSYSGTINVRWFGALAEGDGVGDQAYQIAVNQVAINAALLAGPEVYIPPGTFYYTRLNMNSGNVLRGAGVGATILKNGANAVYPGTLGIVPRNAITTMEVHDLELDGNGPNQAWFDPANPHSSNHHGISMAGAADLTTWPLYLEVSNVYAHDFCRDPFLFVATAVNATDIRAKNSIGDHLIYVQYSANCNISNVDLSGYWFGGAIAVNGANIDNLSVHDITENPYFVSDGLNLLCVIFPRQDAAITGPVKHVIASNLTNLHIEVNTDLSLTSVFYSVGEQVNVDNLAVANVGTDPKAFYVLSLGQNTEDHLHNFIVNKLHVRDASAGMAVMVATSGVNENIILRDVQFALAAGVVSVATALLDIYKDVHSLRVDGLRVYGGTSCTRLLRVGAAQPVDEISLSEVYIEACAGLFAIENYGTIGRLSIRDSVIAGTGTLRSLLYSAVAPATVGPVMIENVTISNNAAFGLFTIGNPAGVGPIVARNVVGNSTLVGLRLPGAVYENCTINGAPHYLDNDGMRHLVGIYSFTEDGGAAGDHVMAYLPDNAIVMNAWYAVIAAVNGSGGATVSMGVDVDDAAGILAPTLLAGLDGVCIPDGTIANATTKATASRAVILTVAGTLTSGTIRVWCDYVVSL